jgi:hypothetical protein
VNLHTRDIEMLGRTMRVRGVVRVLSRALQTSAVASVINTPRDTSAGAAAGGGAVGARGEQGHHPHTQFAHPRRRQK